jgi:hypothetical protein
MSDAPTFEPLLVQSLSRRNLLRSATLAAGAAGSSVGASGLLLGAAPAEAHGTLASHNEIYGQSTYSFNRDTNVMGSSPYPFSYDSTFYARLETWAGFLLANTPGGWAAPIRFAISAVHRDTYIDGTTTLSMHAYGRAMDIERIYMTANNNTTGPVLFQAFNLRGNQITSNIQWGYYWAGVASLMYHFDYVLHYYYAGHADHVHADNTVTTGNTSFHTGSETQVKFVQAALNKVWSASPVLSVDGGYGPNTTTAANRVLARIGRSGSLTSSQTNWLEFCRATTRMGTGAQYYPI